jgi:hypothetical protein
LLKNGDFGIGIFPEREKISISGAGFSGVTEHGIGSSEVERSQRADGFVEHNPAMVEDLLELGCCFIALMRG